MFRIAGVFLCGSMLAAGAQGAAAQAAYPLKLSANHRYLVDQNGKPFFIVGDTPQGLMGRLTEQDAEYYFADREARGFNALGWIDVATACPVAGSIGTVECICSASSASAGG